MDARLSRLFATRIDTYDKKYGYEFEPGQVWQLLRGDQIGAKLQILKIEDETKFGAAIHVRMLGPLYTYGGSELDGIPHLPFLPSALQSTEMRYCGIETEIEPGWEDMYQDWEKDAEEGEAGLLSLAVDEVLSEIMLRLPV